MKTVISYFTLVLACLIVLVSCEDDEKLTIKKDVVKGTPNLAGLLALTKSTQTPSFDELNGKSKESGIQRESGIQTVGLGDQMFAFQGDDLYRIHPDDRTVQWYGNYWSGTEGATIFGGYLYAVCQNHLWKANLTTGVVTDLGCCWGGANLLTNDGTSIYAIQNQYFLKVNPSNGSWQVLGNGNWSGATDLWNYHSGSAQVHIYMNNWNWIVNKTNGSYTWNSDTNYAGFGPAVRVSLTTSGITFGIKNGLLYSQDLYSIGLTQENAGASWSGTVDITGVNYYSGGEVTHLFPLKGGQIHHLRFYGNTTNGGIVNLGPISGLNSVYRVVANDGR